MLRTALANLRTAAADAVAAQKRCYATHLANIGPAKGSTRSVSPTSDIDMDMDTG